MKRVLILLLAALCLSAGANAAFGRVNSYNDDFSDVKENNWYYENVKTAYELGFMNGKDGGLFDPSGSVTVAEGITLAARVHAAYNNTVVAEKNADVEEFRLEFDSMKNIMARGSTNARVEDGVLVMEPKAQSTDIGVLVSGLDLDARDYNKVKVRMKRVSKPNADESAFREERFELFYTTSTSNQFGMDKYLPVALYTRNDIGDDWFDIEINVSAPLWKDFITGIRIDPSNDNGVYYIDYVSFSKGTAPTEKKWYEMYVDYAVENKILARGTYTSNSYNRNITRAELCDLLAATLPEESYVAINDIKGIPDVYRDDKNSDVYLMLYNAGILLGSDSEGNFNPDKDVKRSEVAAIINRLALPENRVKGKISADWSSQGNEYDLEFDDASDLERLSLEAESTEVRDGSLVLKARDRGDKASPRFDPRIIMENVSIDAAAFTKLKVRLKCEFDEEITNTTYEFFFMTEEDSGFSQAKMAYADLLSNAYIDPAGWYVVEIDLATRSNWNGTVTGIRFDPVNTGGTFIIDYIRFTKESNLQDATHEKLLAEGYTATRLLQDEGFERGFEVGHFEAKNVDLENRRWQDYCSGGNEPLWTIGALWSGHDLYDERDTSSDKYTLTDKYAINTVKYNPDEKSLSLHIDATKIYNGKPHDSSVTWWPHLLIEQKPEVEFDKVTNSVDADRVFVELDIKLSDFKPTTNSEGINACQFPAYFYLMTDKAPGQRIWFGLSLFDDRDGGRTSKTPTWRPDSAANMYMYGIPTAVIYGGVENSFTPEKGKVTAGDEWKRIRLDVTSHIQRALEWANRDKIFGADVTVVPEDMYISGGNIGFEIHGNYDCTFEIKNFNMITYKK